MKFKLSVYNLLLICSILFTLNIVSAATLISPAASTNHTTTIALNCTPDIALPLNATFYYNASGGATLTEDALTTITNDTAEDTEFSSSSVSITGLADVATYNWTCFVSNETDIEQSAGFAGITIDNTSPSCTASRTFASVERTKSQTLACTCTDSLDSDPTITRTLTEISGTTLNPTTSPVTVNALDTDEIGQSTWDCSAVDYTGNTGSATQLSFNVIGSSESGDTATAGITNDNNTLLIAGGVVLVLIIIIIIFFSL